MDISVQTGGLIPNWGLEPEEAYGMIRNAGFDGIDWNLNQAWETMEVRKKILKHCIFEDSLEEIQAHFARELTAIQASGLKIVQAHAPYPSYVKDFPEFLDYAIRIFQQCVRYCGLAGIPYLVIHGIHTLPDDHTQTPESVRQMNLKLYESLIPQLLETDVTVCLENLIYGYRGNMMEGCCANPAEAVWYIDHLNEKAGGECFGFCLDTGHLNLIGRRQGAYIRALGSRIKCLHVNDNRGTGDEHLAPYTGNVVWSEFTEALRETGYTGAMNFETFGQIRPEKADWETVPIWLRTICRIGEVFRSKIVS